MSSGRKTGRKNSLQIFRLVNLQPELRKTVEFDLLKHGPVGRDRNGRLPRATCLHNAKKVCQWIRIKKAILLTFSQSLQPLLPPR